MVDLVAGGICRYYGGNKPINGLEPGGPRKAAQISAGPYGRWEYDRAAPWFYAGPYVPSGVVYGLGWPSHSVWLVPGFNPDPPIHQIDLYSPPFPFAGCSL